ncbi:MAG TPA: hypothetical protein VLH09_12385 [Bryobacteraceae bacterium]|nr:hypothetical protein [Bryobacteraceae bacterium]
MNLRVLSVCLGALLILGPATGFAQTLDESFAALKDAEAKKDVELVKKLSAQTHALAAEELAIEEPEAADMKKAWKERLSWARDVDAFSEYALYSLSLTAEPNVAIDLLQTLEKQNPKSRYLDEGGYASYFAALTKLGKTSEIAAVAERGLVNLPNSVDLLLVLADTAMAKQQTGPGLTYSQRLVNAMNRATKPEGVSDADWGRKRSLALGHGYYYIGIIQLQRNAFFEVDRNLRAALPHIQGNNAMMGPALFGLGVANYQLGRQTMNRKRVLEAADFSDKASKIPGSHASDAYRNAQAMRAEAAKMR